MIEELTIPITEKVTIDEPAGVPLLALTQGQCRFPVGDSDVILFCGKVKRDAKSSFSTHHHKVVWVKPRRW